MAHELRLLHFSRFRGFSHFQKYLAYGNQLYSAQIAHILMIPDFAFAKPVGISASR